ncbi:MAG: aldo/keto reductase [Acidobacteriota bacterium]|jgi:aryl-alcohol dehydrogenase-like predicted oxidoreductase|nr:aldo/keto reductase [Acidobacteriota bacterium]
MKYVKFGNAGVQVSALCLGAMTFYERCDEKTSIDIIRKAFDKGINFIDTADAYGRGASEVFLSKALDGIRDDIFLATKFWVPMWPKRINGRGCSRFHIVKAVDASLQRLGTDRIDLIQLHHPDPLVSAEEILSTLDNLVKQGKVLYIGVSNHFAWQMAHLLGVSALHNWEPIVSIQCRYNLLDRPVEIETVPFCQRFNIAMMAYGPQCGGILTGKYKRGEPIPEGSRLEQIKSMQQDLTDETFDVIDKIQAVADKYNMGINQLAVKWVMEQPLCVVPLIGGSKPEHFDPLYDVVDMEIDPEDIKYLNEITRQYRYREFANQPMTAGTSPALNWI